VPTAGHGLHLAAFQPPETDFLEQLLAAGRQFCLELARAVCGERQKTCDVQSERGGGQQRAVVKAESERQDRPCLGTTTSTV
jgi:hypothetical protein